MLEVWMTILINSSRLPPVFETWFVTFYCMLLNAMNSLCFYNGEQIERRKETHWVIKQHNVLRVVVVSKLSCSSQRKTYTTLLIIPEKVYDNQLQWENRCDRNLWQRECYIKEAGGKNYDGMLNRRICSFCVQYWLYTEARCSDFGWE